MVPTNGYAPGSNPANWWWSLQYRTTNNVTFAVGLKGNPAHLLISQPEPIPTLQA